MQTSVPERMNRGVYMKKRLVSAVIAACLMFGSAAALPQNVFTDSTAITASATSLSDFDYKVYDTAVVINKYKGSESSVTIPAQISGKPVTWLNAGAFQNNTSVKKVTLPKTLLGIKESAFEDCTKLEEVIGLENTQITEIKTDVFNGCSSLKKITLPKTLTTISVRAFKGCTSLTDVKELQNTSVKNIYNEAFLECKELYYIEFPSTLEGIGARAFEKCDLRTVDISKTKMKEIYSQSFRENKLLKTVRLPSTITKIGWGAFVYCEKLSDINIPASVTDIDDGAFILCTALWDSKMLINCTSLKHIGEQAFLGCSNLNSLFIPSSVTSIESQAFGYNIEIYDVISGPVWDREYKTVMDVKKFSPARTVIYYSTSATKTAENYADSNGLNKQTISCSHTYTDSETAAATCTQNGNIRHTCTKCGYYYNTTVNAKGHSFSPKRKIVKYATPTRAGQSKHTCEICKAVEYREIYPSNVRVYGKNRYETATQIADKLKTEYNEQPYACYVIADGRSYADALSASYLARVCDAPLLLVAPGGEKVVTDYIQQTCGDKKPTAWVVGGTGAVTEASFNKIKAVCGTVSRIDGANRYETSRKVLFTASLYAALTKKDLGSSVIVADGRNYADALSASATGQPILLVNGKAKGLTQKEKDSITMFKNISSVTIVGGEGAVSKEIESDAKKLKTVKRVFGNNRYETSVEIAKTFFKTPSAVTLATGLNFPDGLCGGPLGYKTNCPLILTAKNAEAIANAYVKSTGVKTAWILGGTPVVSDDTVKAVFK